MKKEEVSDSAGVVSFVLSILSIAFAVQLPLGSVAGILLAVLGLIFGLVQLNKGKNSWAVWGIVLSIISIIVNVMVLLWIAQLASEVIAKMQELKALGALPNQLPPIPQ